MQILSLDQASVIFGIKSIESFFNGADWEYPDLGNRYFLPTECGRKVTLAHILADLFLSQGPAILWISGTGIWGASEQMDLALKYREFYGERRSIAESPIHITKVSEKDGLTSLLCLALFFQWDFELMAQDRVAGITVSHDEWVQYRFLKTAQAFDRLFFAPVDRLLREPRIA